MPKFSIVVPVYDMPNGEFFYRRLVQSLDEQTFTDWELVVTKEGKMAENTNAGIKRSKGKYIKILYMDDYLAHPDSLQVLSDALDAEPDKQWLVSGCKHDPGTHTHLPTWNDEIQFGVNTIGSPSVLTIKNEEPLLFDENMTWLLDCDLYRRYYDLYGEPIFLNDINVTIGIHEGQSTHLMGDEIKLKEHQMMQEKYNNFSEEKYNESIIR